MPRSRRPKLGQHFLADTRFRRRIAESLDVRPGELLIEIGPGRGAMTGLLAARARRVVAIELDTTLADNLRQTLSANPRIEILAADVLAADISEVCRRHETPTCFVFGNLPYYITSPVLHHLFRFSASIRAMALVMQREVAERLVAGPARGSGREYGYLSVLTQFHSRPQIAFGIPPGAFAPPPEVESALVEFEMTPRFPEWSTRQGQSFLDFVKGCFAHKRKNLLNNLGGAYPRERVEQALAGLDWPPTVRAEELTLEEFAELLGRLG